MEDGVIAVALIVAVIAMVMWLVTGSAWWAIGLIALGIIGILSQTRKGERE